MLQHLACLNEEIALLELYYSVEVGFSYSNFITLFIYVSAFFWKPYVFRLIPTIKYYRS